MTAGLPGTLSGGSTFLRRILAATLIATIAIAPARAQPTAIPDITDAVVADIEVPTTTESSGLVQTHETSPDAAPVETIAPTADAETTSTDPVAPLDQVIYKGFVGNLLEAMPLDPEQRVQLQRGNAVINNAFTGRSLALLLGIASPPLMLAGLIWGIWSAVNIKSAPPDTRTAAVPLTQPEVQTEQAGSSSEAPQRTSPADGSAVLGPRAAAQALD